MVSSTISILSILIIITHSICSAANPPSPPPPETGNRLRNDSDSLRKASNDYGNIVHEIPSGVLYPSTEKDIIDLIGTSCNSPKPFTVAARGHGHSVRGQAMAGGGVVVDMSALGANRSRIRIEGSSSSGFYADVGGEQLWIDVLSAALKWGLAPVSWTDYVYLTVGGTLSNAGISGQAFLHGPQIANVLELDVVTGKGEFMTCSRRRNPELFYGVLGGLGQFGIITRARIVLHKAPTRVKWAKLLYSNFLRFSKDQEYLISMKGANYVEGFLITNENETNEWSSSGNQSDVVALLKKQGILYAIELVKWDERMSAVVPDDEEVFFALSLLHTSHPDNYEYIDKFNKQILDYCISEGIKVKEYLPNIKSNHEWKKHFGSKWRSCKTSNLIAMAMALSLPSNFLSPPSNTSPPQSLLFLEFHPKIHSSRIFRARKLKISCCQQTVQIDDEANLLKKKRKLRPSFLEQVQSKWSHKNTSLRENFPWQQEEIGEPNQEFHESSSNASTVKEAEKTQKSSRTSEPVAAHVKIKSNSAPWDHGSRNRNVIIAERLKNSAENVVKGTDGVHEHCQNEESLVSVVQSSENLVKDVIIDSKRERKYREFDEVSIRLPEKNENLDAEESRSANVVEESPTVRRNVGNSKRSAGGDGLNKLPWERMNDEEVVKNGTSRNKKMALAERSIPEHELKRLRNVSLRMVERIKVGAAGVTQALVNDIHEKWEDEEVVKLKFEGPPSKNMRRTQEFLESRTGGLVIWRSGSSVVLYRGMTYKLDCVKSYSQQVDAGALGSSGEESPKSIKVDRLNGDARSSALYNSTYFKSLPEEEQMNLSELNLLLDDLGPRLLPHGTRKALRDKGMTYLRREARTIPPHFALGRSRELQGLAVAMVKLWETSSIAKIVIKRGVLNTNNERMAEELKILTGGTLLSRNKEFIVFYRGRDFLPPRVSSALIEAEKRTTLQQDEEEHARLRAAALIEPKSKASKQQLVAGTLAETMAATSRWGNEPNSAEKEKMMRDAAVSRQASLVNSLQRRLAFAKEKMRKADKNLQKVLKNKEPEELPTDLETLTDEERFLFRRIGLSMKPFLVLGRREIFDGTIENMHLHWKFRELVKIMVERKTFAQVRHIALELESESGGVLVSVDRTHKGYVIIVYRGKNYQQPLAFRPRNLLTKRQALARSVELQRREALKHHIVELEENIEKMEQKLDDMMRSDGECDGKEAEMIDTVGRGQQDQQKEDEQDGSLAGRRRPFVTSPCSSKGLPCGHCESSKLELLVKNDAQR
ncbi:hypothetical protein C2S52_010326 [Perilla frutescens var. hirtella]|nr:hypothetical protein C2S52_010326 [Perilla frutescens var. hirtella]